MTPPPGSGAGGPRVLLVPDLAVEHWPSMDRYAAALAQRLPVAVPEAVRTVDGLRYLARYVRYPRALRREPRPALVHIADHSYAHCLAAFPGVPAVVTVHDLYPVHVLRQGSGGGGVRAAARSAMVRYVLRHLPRADRLVAVSRCVAEEAARLLDYPAVRIAVAPNGVDDAFFAPPHGAVITERREGWVVATGGAGRARVLLHVGLCVARKRIDLVVATLGELRRQGVEAVLVQIGGTFTAAQREQIAGLGLTGYVVQEPRVTESSLVTAYHAADAVLLPSSYEGFGLPVLEGLAAGRPVVTSGAGGMREAGGDAAVVVESDDPARYAEALAALLLEDGTARAARRERGIAHARRHSWDATAQAIRAVYAELGIEI